MAQLEREEAELKAEYATVHEAAKASTIKAAVKDQTAQITEGAAAPDLDAQTIAAVKE